MKLNCVSLLIVAFLGAAQIARAEELPPDIAVVSYSTKKDKRILELTIDSLDVSVQHTDYGAPIAELHGKFKNKNSTLIWESYKVLDPPFTSYQNKKVTYEVQEFTINVPLKGISTTITLLSVDLFGREQREELVITYPAYGKHLTQQMQRQARARRLAAIQTTTEVLPSKNLFSLAVGYTATSYSETDLSDFSQNAVTAKAALQTKLSQNWNAAFNGYYTTLPISSNLGGTNIQFLGINGRIGYSIPFIPQPWKLSIMGGLYYTTSFTKASTAFGFTDMMGPQVYPVLQYQFANNNTVYIYGKYSPISQGSLSFSFASTEMAFGGGYSFSLANGKSVSLMADYANLNLNFSNILFIKSNSMTMSLGYNW